MADKLLIVDCDGVLYHPSELDINAMVYAFNDVYVSELEYPNTVEAVAKEIEENGYSKYKKFVQQ